VTRTCPEDRCPDRQALAVTPFERGRIGGVDVDDRQVAVTIEAGHRADEAAPVREGDGDLIPAKVVGVGEDLARGDDDAGAARPAADPDD
jgi:hypothetical protein